MKYLITLMTLVLFLTGCGAPPVDTIETPGVNLKLMRLVDKEAGVACWYSNKSEGLSCLPIKETKLYKGE